MMDQATYNARVKAFLDDMNSKGMPPEMVAEALLAMEKSDKTAKQMNIAYKSSGADRERAVAEALERGLELVTDDVWKLYSAGRFKAAAQLVTDLMVKTKAAQQPARPTAMRDDSGQPLARRIR